MKKQNKKYKALAARLGLFYYTFIEYLYIIMNIFMVGQVRKDRGKAKHKNIILEKIIPLQMPILKGGGEFCKKR